MSPRSISWRRRYDPGMNLASVLLARAATDPGAAALRSETATLTYGELDDRSGNLAGDLRARLMPGARIGIVTGNVPLFVVAYVAALRAGMIAVPLDPTSPAAELSRSLGTVDAALVVASERHSRHRGLDGYDVVALGADGLVPGVETPTSHAI